MFPPPSPPAPASPAAPAPEPKKQSAGLLVLAVALAVLLSMVGLVWYLNARQSDDDGRPFGLEVAAVENLSTPPG